MRQLASRAATRSSLNRALDLLTRLELSVLDALVASRATPPTRNSCTSSTPSRPLSRAPYAGCSDLALVWESDAGLRPLTGVPEALGSLSELHPMTPGRYAGRGRAAAGRAVAGRAGDARARRGRRPARPTPARRGAPISAGRGGEPGRGAAVAWAAGAGPAAARAGARGGADRAARRAHHPRAGRRTARAWRPPSGTPPWSTAPRPARRSRRYAGWSCWSTTGAPHPPVALRSGAAGGARPQGGRRLRPARRAGHGAPGRGRGRGRAAGDLARPRRQPRLDPDRGVRRLVRRARRCQRWRRLAPRLARDRAAAVPGRHPRRRRQDPQRARPRADQPDRPRDAAR